MKPIRLLTLFAALAASQGSLALEDREVDVLADAEDLRMPPTPLKVKQAFDRELLESGVDFLTSTAVRRVFRSGGRLTGVETVNRSGRQVVRAKEVVDATLYGLLGKIPAVGPEETFSRIVISNDSRPSFGDMKVEEIPADIDNPRYGFRGKMWRCTFSVPMEDGTFPSFAAADWSSLASVRTPRTGDIADVLLWHPSPAAVANARPMPDEIPVWGEYDVVVVGGAETRLDERNCPPFSDGGGRVGVKTLEKVVRFFPDLEPSVRGKLPPPSRVRALKEAQARRKRRACAIIWAMPYARVTA